MGGLVHLKKVWVSSQSHKEQFSRSLPPPLCCTATFRASRSLFGRIDLSLLVFLHPIRTQPSLYILYSLDTAAPDCHKTKGRKRTTLSQLHRFILHQLRIRSRRGRRTSVVNEGTSCPFFHQYCKYLHW